MSDKSATNTATAQTSVRGALFKAEKFTGHSGYVMGWKVECDALGDGDWDGLAKIASELLPAFGSVEGVPRGGIKFAESLVRYATHGPLLIADDVCTTGLSLEATRRGRDVIGVVAFARGPCPAWVCPVWRLNQI